MKTSITEGRRVAITGIGIVSPFGIGKDLFWKGLSQGNSGITGITLFDPTFLPCRIAAEVKMSKDLEKLLSPRELRRVPRLVPISLKASEEALEDACLLQNPLNEEERRGVEVILGTGAGGIEFGEDQYEVFFKMERGHKKISPFSIVASLPGMLSSEVSLRFGFRGASHVISTGCTSSTDAIGYALHRIRYGMTDIVLAGGIEACVTPALMSVFCNMGVVSTAWNGEPAKASRPFNRDRDGFVLGEGAWILVLEELRRARDRGVRIYGEVAGFGSTCDAYHKVQIEPSGEDPARAMGFALKDGGLRPEDVEYISLHGTSTPLNDRVETRSIKVLFGKRAYKIPMSSIKSMIGHPQGASGAAGVVATILAMNEALIPPTINYENPAPECDLDYTPNEAIRKDVKVALCNCIGFGSKNSALVLKCI